MAFTLGANPPASTPVVIDTDPGLDDALALLLAFRVPGWRVEAITTVAGNVPVDVGTRNVARILGVVRPASPVLLACGAVAPRIRPLVTATHVHGDDGLGGLGARYAETPIARHPRDAAELLVACARRWTRELVVVALGPLTNLANALDQDADALHGVRAVVAMGGAIAVGGNVTAVAEFNVFADPEAAEVVLAAGLPLTLVPLDITQQVLWTVPAIERLAAADDPVARFAGEVGRAGLTHDGESRQTGFIMHDPLAVGVAADPTLVEVESHAVEVETAGALTRGMTVVDRRPRAGRESARPACQVALRVDAGRFLRLFETRLWPASA